MRAMPATGSGEEVASGNGTRRHEAGGAAPPTSPVRDLMVNGFRARRGAVLRAQIDDLVALLGRPITVLDVGGRADYWTNVGVEGIERVLVVNIRTTELNRPGPADIFEHAEGDARDLREHGDEAFDLVHSNSVIEHVGGWLDMTAMAAEVRRVGRSGWIQTPAWGFPIEPHFRAPFLHWFGGPLRRTMMSLSFEPHFRRLPLERRRGNIDGVNLLSRRELEALFPGCDIYVERVVLAKSFTARWMPAPS